MRVVLIVLITTLASVSGAAQPPEDIEQVKNDTLPVHSIRFKPSAASEYIGSLLQLDSLWREEGDTLSLFLSRLVDHYNESFDSVKTRILGFDYDAVRPELTTLARYDTIPLRWFNDTVFIVDTVPLEKEPFITQKTFINKKTIVTNRVDTLPELQVFVDSIWHEPDTITEVFLDTLYLKSRDITLHRVADQDIRPPLFPPGSRKELAFLPDSSHVVISERYQVFVADEDSPFYVVPGRMTPDSLRMAVEELLHHIYVRDSIPLYISDHTGERQPFWLTAEPDDLMRYWVRNQENDSITIWMGNPSKHEIRLVLEDDIHVERMGKMEADDIPITTLEPDHSLLPLQPLDEIPGTWRYGLSSAFSLNQNYLSNWARGGESSLASLLDLRVRAQYRNIDSEIKWTNSARFRYGNIISEEFGFRTNTDILELNSQMNKNISENIDFSSVFYGKTQVSKGYDYPNDSIPISRFLSPGTFTIGAGFEYEPFANTTLNFSALSYRSTFVLDTTQVNQRAHGIERGKRARHEMGGQLVINNEMTLLDDLKIQNSVRLFSNYLDSPQNVDVDWEINLEKKISWYFTVSLNLHLIYDENILFPVLDDQGDPVTLPDGSPREKPRVQLKQFLGITMSLSI